LDRQLQQDTSQKQDGGNPCLRSLRTSPESLRAAPEASEKRWLCDGGFAIGAS
jgi:hypothetical protein